MSAEPTDVLFQAVRTRLLSEAQIAAAVGQRIASDWGVVLDAPFIRMSVRRVEPDDDECGEGARVHFRVHVWAKQAATVACETIAGQVRAALHEASFPIAGHDLDECTYVRTDYLNDRDDPTLRMGVAEFVIVTTVNS